METRGWASLLGTCALLLGGVAGAGAVSGCEFRARTETPPLSPDSAQAGTPSQITRDARFMLRKGGQPRAMIRAEHMEQYQTADSTYSVWRGRSDSARVHSYVFDAAGDSSATIIADSVVFFSQEGRFEAYGNVRVRTDDNRRLESEHLTWNQIDRTIRTRRFVHITTPTEEVRGNGLVADEDLETYQIGRFQAEVEIEDEDPSEK
ncbi:LPS export ABC transporter periplasmic protein LptC [Salinibacter sp. 10B]|uniref:LPS export ABC transporter periplasmic protein LptC n=1 Tax=Salinibacter sp. 10B TaxID=1923971 RepID=UPI000CF53CAA|nr:LPS export ABC transporter periplasmic protein LptC [Salinibacter sp. 10B]